MNTQIQNAVEQFRQQGFCAYESILDENEQAHIRGALDEYWQEKGKGKPQPGFGISINPLLPELPVLSRYFAREIVVETLRELLQDEVRLVHAGARISNQSFGPRIDWHVHYSWDQTEIPGRSKPTRILIGYYVDGTQLETGPLVVLPRQVDEAIGPPRGPSNEYWPGEQEVLLNPGSVVIFDTALWHCAKTGTENGMRRLFGAHYQGWSQTRTHPEDNACDSPEVLAETRDNPVFRALVKRS